ncbi:helix-turn-helix transcriptional regulator [Acidithiobacillus sp.]
MKEHDMQGLTREDGVRALLPVAHSTLWRMVQKGQFPKPIKIGRASFWKRTDVLEWIERQRSDA